MSTRPPRRSLADAFTPATAPDRSAGLTDLLPPRPGATARPADNRSVSSNTVAQVRSEPAAREQGAAEPSPQEPRSVRSRQASAQKDLDKVRNVAVYVPLPVLEAFRKTSRSREMTYADLLVEAASAHLEGLQDHFRNSPQPATFGMPVRSSRAQPQPQVQVQVRLDGHQIAWLDAQAERLGAPSRSALMVALLRTHLGVTA